MSTLEDKIHELVSRGEMTHCSLTPSQNGKLWRASFSPSSKFGNSFAEDVDPVKALMLAFTTAKMKRHAPTDRALASMEATSTGKIEQETVDMVERPVDADLEAMM